MKQLEGFSDVCETGSSHTHLHAPPLHILSHLYLLGECVCVCMYISYHHSKQLGHLGFGLTTFSLHTVRFDGNAPLQEGFCTRFWNTGGEVCVGVRHGDGGTSSWLPPGKYTLYYHK